MKNYNILSVKDLNLFARVKADELVYIEETGQTVLKLKKVVQAIVPKESIIVIEQKLDL
jgi:hypothetical protein